MEAAEAIPGPPSICPNHLAVGRSRDLLPDYGCNPHHVYSDISPIVFFGSYSQKSVLRIAASRDLKGSGTLRLMYTEQPTNKGNNPFLPCQERSVILILLGEVVSL